MLIFPPVFPIRDERKERESRKLVSQWKVEDILNHYSDYGILGYVVDNNKIILYMDKNFQYDAHVSNKNYNVGGWEVHCVFVTKYER